MVIGKAAAELLDARCRLVDLLDNPHEIPFLSGLIKREIIYRVLCRPEGARLRAIAAVGNHLEPLRVEELAQLAVMRLSTFHHIFAC
jgi:hypothetical protein